MKSLHWILGGISMCTIGAITGRDRAGEVRSFLLKTADCWAGCEFHHSIETSEGGVRRIDFSVEPQLGVNSGLNEYGLGVVISYSDYRFRDRSEEHTSELQSRPHLVCR